MDITVYFMGQLLGRLAASVLVVWLVCWLLSRLKFKPAWHALKRGYSLLAILMIWVLGMVGNIHAGEDTRAMIINQVDPLDLVIWTEAEPEWITRTEMYRDRPVFIAETPEHYYPPAAMSWTVMPFSISDAEMPGVMQQALRGARQNYNRSDTSTEALTPALITDQQYGTLRGQQAEFNGRLGDTPVDVQFFIGAEPGKPAVMMQVYTLQGKLPHLEHQIRRSWNNVHYMKNQ